MSSESVPSPTYLLKVKKAFQVILESTSISMDAVCITELIHLYETLQHTRKTCLWDCDCLKNLTWTNSDALWIRPSGEESIVSLYSVPRAVDSLRTRSCMALRCASFIASSEWHSSSKEWTYRNTDNWNQRKNTVNPSLCDSSFPYNRVYQLEELQRTCQWRIKYRSYIALLLVVT